MGIGREDRLVGETVRSEGVLERQNCLAGYESVDGSSPARAPLSPNPLRRKKFSSWPEKDITDRTGGAEGDSVAFHLTERERVFWSDFENTHPRPPDELERKQLEIEADLLASKKWTGINQNIISGILKSEKEDAIRQNFPPEAFSDDALHWAQLANWGQQYENTLQSAGADAARANVRISSADLNELTNARTTESIKAANAWKIAYLQRLKRENVDASYISAYLQAWNLSSNDVFGAGN
jgi:hypothetical protein